MTPLVKGVMSGNISPSISDHLPQFFILPDLFSNSPPTEYKTIFHEWENFNNLQLNQNNVNITFENYPNTVNTLINSHAPLKNTTKTKESFHKNHRLQKESKIQLKRKIGFLKSKLNVVIVTKIFYRKNIKHMEISY